MSNSFIPQPSPLQLSQSDNHHHHHRHNNNNNIQLPQSAADSIIIQTSLFTPASILYNNTNNNHNNHYPHAIGSHHYCSLLHSNNYSEVEIIERRCIPGRKQEYYIHFVDLNRRLDRWVNEDELIPLPNSSTISNTIITINNNNNNSNNNPSSVALLQQSPLINSKSIKDNSTCSPILSHHSENSLLISHSPINAHNNLNDNKRLTRRDKRKLEGISDLDDNYADHHFTLLSSSSSSTTILNHNNLNALDAAEAELEREHEEKTKVKNINSIIIGQYELDCWYYSPFPHKYRYESVLYFCEFCFKYCKLKSTMDFHYNECRYRHPPGTEIYRDGNLSAFEVDGDKHRIYCQNLCLLSKLFIDHKTAYYDVEPFLFYILTEYQPKQGYRIVGYFSKEKHSAENNNVACILTFPQYQRKGYGKFLISLSYGLSRIENKIGSPEKPLSDLGKISYKSYWTEVLIKLLSSMCNSQSGSVTIPVAEVSVLTCIKQADIISTLRTLELIRYIKGTYVISCNTRIIDAIQTQLVERESVNNYQLYDHTKLKWTPIQFPKEVNRKKSQAGKLAHAQHNITNNNSNSTSMKQ